jgi:hypothetical protein
VTRVAPPRADRRIRWINLFSARGMLVHYSAPYNCGLHRKNRSRRPSPDTGFTVVGCKRLCSHWCRLTGVIWPNGQHNHPALVTIQKGEVRLTGGIRFVTVNSPFIKNLSNQVLQPESVAGKSGIRRAWFRGSWQEPVCS